MDLEKAQKKFMEYTNNYDANNGSIARKIGHSIRVMEISGEIAKDLNLNNEQIELAKMIGLLHDIARFEQMKRYGTFKDSESCDHGDLGVELLKEDNFIRKFVDEDKYDKVILKAIKNHNKYKIEDNLTEEELLFSKIIRDADKLDIMYEGVEMFWKDKQEVLELEESDITTKVYEQFISNLLIMRNTGDLPADRLVTFLAFIFDINFKCSYRILKQEDYINKILNRFNFKHKEKLEKIREIANKYIETKIEDDRN